MKTFKTPKGTELPLRDMRGKDYLDVQYRVLWMREEHTDWGITTEIVTHDDTKSIVRATILDNTGKILAQGTKSETIGDFKDHLEKAETGATGRALALCGYGTQFAQELEEGDRIVDGPREPKPSRGIAPMLQAVAAPSLGALDPGAYVMVCKPHTGLRLDTMDIYKLNDWAKGWAGKSISGALAKDLAAAEAFLKSRETTRGVK